jgi:hypothetical protein
MEYWSFHFSNTPLLHYSNDPLTLTFFQGVKSMNAKIYLMIVLFICIGLVVGCGKKEEYQTGEMTTEELAKDATDVLTIKPKPINYDSMLVVVGDLVEAIKNNPTDIELRRRLVAVSYDSTWDTILTAGFGKRFQDAKTESIALKYAEQAARADAYRWAVYIKKWLADPTVPDVGKLDVEIEGSRVVAKKVLSDSTVSVLVEIHSSNIP